MAFVVFETVEQKNEALVDEKPEVCYAPWEDFQRIAALHTRQK